ncbi:glycosyl hydrolase family 3 N terminal domain-containing protein [Limtongia smithiae]|uniref:glycosyl hydrolase family 3 N terminal domain-containing protein n=1 Tax=Limtongia smithiae TaxID=1125753 RepID=UPI0034CE76EA
MARSLFLRVLVFCGVLLGGVRGKTTTATTPSYTSVPVYPAPLGGRNSQDNDWLDAYDKARAFVTELTLLEKINLTTGTGWEMGPCVGNTGTIPRLGFTSLCLQDSPTGVRYADYNSLFPAGLATAATFNKELMYQRGQALGKEFLAKGANAILGPAVGPMGRTPEGGRNWETFGPEPYLQGIAGALSVLGIQDQGVMATAKHFLLYEQEHFRQVAEFQGFGWSSIEAPYSSNVDDRTLHEVYAWPFADMIRAGVASVMCSYNMANNSQACQNSYLLNRVLKDELGFQGFVMSDWGGQRSGVASALAGLDMTMPGDGLSWADDNPLWGPQLALSVLNGSVPIWRLDDMATRIMAAYYKVGQDQLTIEPNFQSWSFDTYGAVYPRSYDTPYATINKHVNARSALSSNVTATIATESMVLLKNNGGLPLQAYGSLALLGSAAGPPPLGPNGCENLECNNGTLGMGWGSGTANYPYLVTPLEAINAKVRANSMSLAYNLDDDDLDGCASTAENMDAAIVFITSDSGECLASVEGNIGDRNDLYAWHSGDDLVKAVAAVNTNTIVVVETVGAIDMEAWIENENVTAVLYAIVAGQDVGTGIAEILFGDSSPSGKLPFTVAKNTTDYPASVAYTMSSTSPQINYTEGIFIDYKHFDKNDITPRYEFGYGLSYTTFEISDVSAEVVDSANISTYADTAPAYLDAEYYNETYLPSSNSLIYPDDIPRYEYFIYPYLTVKQALNVYYNDNAYPYPNGYSTEQASSPSPSGGASGGNPALWDVLATVSASVSNTGSVYGGEVVQLYISYPTVTDIDFPIRSLRGFEKVFLDAGDSATVGFNLTRRDLSYWDVITSDWVLPSGEFGVYVGNSSRNAVNTASFEL